MRDKEATSNVSVFYIMYFTECMCLNNDAAKLAQFSNQIMQRFIFQSQLSEHPRCEENEERGGKAQAGRQAGRRDKAISSLSEWRGHQLQCHYKERKSVKQPE